MNHKLTAMRNGVYVMLAVVMGVMLIGMLPGQVSNIAAPIVNRDVSLQTSGTKSPQNITRTDTTGTNVSPLNKTLEDAAKNTTQATSAKPESGTITGANINYDFSYTQRVGANYLYTDNIYYGLWGVGLVTAILVYLVSKRTLV